MPLVYLLFGAAIGMLASEIINRGFLSVYHAKMEASFDHERAEILAQRDRDLESSRRAVEMLRDNVRRAIPKGTDRGVIRATNKLRLAIGDEPWPGGEPCDCNPPCGEDVAPETTTPTRGPGCAES